MENGAMNNPIDRRSYKNSLAFMDMKDMNSPWRSVLHLGRQTRRAKGEDLQAGKELLFLDRGRVRLVHPSPEGTEKILWYIREGCVVGEVPFFDPTPEENVCICMTACLLYAFSPENVSRICRERPELMFNLFQSMAHKMKILGSQASALCLDSVLTRICKFLSQRLVPNSNPLVANIGMSRQEMASLLGIHRISLYRVLHQQQKRGLFGPITGNTITILQPHDFYKLTGA
jgi:CRP-like cAMP-binding protein